MAEEPGLFPDKDQKVTDQSEKKRRRQAFRSYDQEQTFLFPDSLDNYIGAFHIARLINAVVDSLDMSDVEQSYDGGASAYSPKMLLKVWLLGYVNRIYTTRPLEKALCDSFAFSWISGRQHPSFKTLSNFRGRLKKEIKVIFKDIVRMLIAKHIITGEEMFVDHTKFEADANRHRIVWKKGVEKRLKSIDEELDRLLAKIDRIQQNGEKEDRGPLHENRIKKALEDGTVDELISEVNRKLKEGRITRGDAREEKADLRRTKELSKQREQYQSKLDTLGDRNSYSMVDTDATAMMMKDEVIRPGYNEGIAVSEGFVTSYAISQNAADNVSFKEIVDIAIENTGKNPSRVCADSAYGNEENLKYLEEKEIESFVKYPTFHYEQSLNYHADQFKQEVFLYNEHEDSYTCPAGKRLDFVYETKRSTSTGYEQDVRVYEMTKGGCTDCPLKPWCTKSDKRSLTINREFLRLKATAKRNLVSEKGKAMRKKRGYNVETVFGDRKGNHGFRRFNLRRIDNVVIESGLYYSIYNIKRLYRLLLKKMMKGNWVPQLTMNEG